jgi:hypothetical protein
MRTLEVAQLFSSARVMCGSFPAAARYAASSTHADVQGRPRLHTGFRAVERSPGARPGFQQVARSERTPIAPMAVATKVEGSGTGTVTSPAPSASIGRAHLYCPTVTVDRARLAAMGLSARGGNAFARVIWPPHWARRWFVRCHTMLISSRAFMEIAGGLTLPGSCSRSRALPTAYWRLAPARHDRTSPGANAGRAAPTDRLIREQAC